MKVLITGATGLIGRSLCERLQGQAEIHATTRNKQRARQLLPDSVQLHGDLSTLDMNKLDAVINLQGEPIADKRWTKAQKQRIETSRWAITSELADAMLAAQTPPEVFISGSAIGYYGPQASELTLTEESAPVTGDFAQQLCARWEALAEQVQANGRTRVCTVRTGVVLSSQGGALKKMLPAYKLGLGGPIGSGTQMFSWIHLADMVGLLEHLLMNQECQGAYNATAPHPVTNRAFSETLARVLHRPHLFKVPAFALKLGLGEAASMLLTGQKVVPQKLLDAGFRFRYGTVSEALMACVSRPS